MSMWTQEVVMSNAADHETLEHQRHVTPGQGRQLFPSPMTNETETKIHWEPQLCREKLEL